VEEDPWTFAAMMAGTLAITGVGLEEIGGFAGFYSKDAIIEAAYAKGTGLGHFAAWMGIIAALLTSFYSWRLVFLTFFGKPRWNQSEHIQHALHDSHGHGHEDHAHGHDHHGHGHKHDDDGTAGYHPHESPLVMMIPLAILSFGAVFAGAIFHHAFTGIEGAPEFWRGALVFNKELAEAAEHIPELIKLAPFIVMVLGLVTAWVCYSRFPAFPPLSSAPSSRCTPSSTTSGSLTSCTTSSSFARLLRWASCSGRLAISASSTASVPMVRPGRGQGFDRGAQGPVRFPHQLCAVDAGRPGGCGHLGVVSLKASATGHANNERFSNPFADAGGSAGRGYRLSLR
jgi:NADH:ubiquinone oxidoreductase subunit 5 (subunit L)/multisubunit Na+/H+ antiporter MnhA subunit